MKSSQVQKYFTDEAAADFFETLKCADLRHLAVNCMTWEVGEKGQTEPRRTDCPFFVGEVDRE
jgi:hypothetical protein